MTQPEKDLILEMFARLDQKMDLTIAPMVEKLCTHSAELEELKKMKWKITGVAIGYSSVISIIVSIITIYISFKKIS